MFLLQLCLLTPTTLPDITTMALNPSDENIYILPWGDGFDKKTYYKDLESLPNERLILLLARLRVLAEVGKHRVAELKEELKLDNLSNIARCEKMIALHRQNSAKEVHTAFTVKVQAILSIRKEQARLASEQLRAEDLRARKREREARKREREQLVPEHRLTYDGIMLYEERKKNSILVAKLQQFLGDEGFEYASDSAFAQAIRETQKWLQTQDIPEKIRSRYCRRGARWLKKLERRHPD